MKFNKDQNYCASTSATNDFLLIETLSMFGMACTDPVFSPHLLPPDAGDEYIGEVILKSLSDSRTLTSEEEATPLFDPEKNKEQYAAWIKMLMDRYGYKTKKALFKNMKHCSIHYRNNVLTISPSRHETLEGWGGLDDSEDVILSLDNTPAEIGAGLRLALSRCKG